MKLTRVFKEAVLLGVIALLPATTSWALWQRNNADLAPYEVSIHDPRLEQRPLVWVDARSQEEFDKGHIPAAVRLSDEQWDTLVGDLFAVWQPESTLVVYCSAGCPSSEKIASRLREMGLEPTYFLRGGYPAWKKIQ